MSLKFAANLNFLFTECSSKLHERLTLAHQAGFRAVEMPYPPENELPAFINAKESTGMEISLMNIKLDPTQEKYKLGTACHPEAKQKFQQQLRDTVELAEKLNCKKIHIMAGLVADSAAEQSAAAVDSSAHLKAYRENLHYAADLLAQRNICGVIEPINKYSVPSYFMNSYDLAVKLLREINSPHLRLMVDVFHLQYIQGNITHSLEDLKDVIGHFQIAQVPHRHEPNVAGEIDYAYVFGLLEKMAYHDWIGCEYKPKAGTKEGLKWLAQFGYNL